MSLVFSRTNMARSGQEIIEFGSSIPYRLAATATPAPNDLPEILNHAAYLGRMNVKEALAMWFSSGRYICSGVEAKGTRRGRLLAVGWNVGHCVS